MNNTAKKSNELTAIQGFEPMNNVELNKINGGKRPPKKVKIKIVVRY